MVFLLYPVIFGITISFFKWNGMSVDIFKNFVGFGNYKALLEDGFFFVALKNTMFFPVGSVIVQNLLGFFIAVFIFFGRFKNSDLIRAIIFLPGVLSGVLVALIWKQMLASDGFINSIEQAYLNQSGKSNLNDTPMADLLSFAFDEFGTCKTEDEGWVLTRHA